MMTSMAIMMTTSSALVTNETAVVATSAAEPTLPPIDSYNLFVYSNSCDPRLLESYDAQQDVVSDNSHIALLVFAAIAVVLEAVALTVLARPAATRFGSMQRSLVALTAMEIIALSTFRLVIRQVLVCTNLDNVVLHVRSDQTSWLQVVSEKIFFAYQSAIPITVVTIATIFMIVVLLRHRVPSERRKEQRWSVERKPTQKEGRNWKCWRGGRSTPRDDGGGCVVPSLQAVRQAQRLPNQMRATRFILFIATVFIACEAPVFFAVVCVNSMSPTVVIWVFTYLRFLIIADSFANFVIYLLTSRPFRVELVNLLTCRRRRDPLSSTSLPTSNQLQPSRTSVQQV
ncbi:unnamed protein product [Hydatigera taeniaeformis]|uniref:G_PROTEIN_RECEP_F1_2 domain-containing protein n=1 Tax=Hydatigena taeniaeformis TaxID=6205 RepID=A0A0R3X5F6_HYDTA|nr:unnamed protein product [Hydatigera taeniaeformis]